MKMVSDVFDTLDRQMMLLELFDAKQLLEARKDALLHETVTEVVCPDPILGGTLRIRFDGKALKEKFG